MFGFVFGGRGYLLSRSRIILKPLKSGICIVHAVINELAQCLIVTDVPGQVEHGPLDDSDPVQRTELGLNFLYEAVFGL